MLQMQALQRTAGQDLLDTMAAVNAGTVPGAHHAAGHFAQAVLKKGREVDDMDGMVFAIRMQLACRGKGADGGELGAGRLFPQHCGASQMERLV